jgi:hypothetical protein
MGLSKALKKSIKDKTDEWRYSNFRILEGHLEFTPGIVDFSPGWFMRGRDVRIIYYVII